MTAQPLPDLDSEAGRGDAELLEAFGAWLRMRGLSEGTERVYVNAVRRMAAGTGTRLLEVTPVDLRRWVTDNPSWGPVSVNLARKAAASFYRWAMYEELLDVDPSAAMPSARVRQGLPKPVPEDVLAAAIARADWQGRRILLLGAYAGLRRSEIALVHSDNITAEGLRIVGKGAKTRIVPLHPVLIAELQDVNGWALPSPAAVDYHPAYGGGHLSANHVAVMAAKWLGGGYSTHSLRHRFATRAYAATHDLRAVQTLLGHASVATTQIYVQVAADSLTAAVMAL